MKNRIKELRTQRGWSLEQLAEAVGDSTGTSTMNKLERGAMKLTTDWMVKLGRAFGVDPIEIVDDRPRLGLDEGVIPYRAEDGPPALASPPTQTHGRYRVTSDALDEIGILAGDVIEVDESETARDDIQTGDIVVANVMIGPGDTITTVVREFVEPSLLITNARTANAVPINIRSTQASIVGVVVGSHRQINRRR
ncbi:MAG: helix-turn-helix domain-containing protein [Pseudomonadota bacterium]